MVTFAIISLVGGNVFINDTFQADDSKRGEVSAVYAECKAAARMLTPCMLISERRDGLIIFSDVETGYQLVVEK